MLPFGNHDEMMKVVAIVIVQKIDGGMQDHMAAHKASDWSMCHPKSCTMPGIKGKSGLRA